MFTDFFVYEHQFNPRTPGQWRMDCMLQQGIQLGERFAQDGRVRIRRPSSKEQIQFGRPIEHGFGQSSCSNGGFQAGGGQLTRREKGAVRVDLVQDLQNQIRVTERETKTAPMLGTDKLRR